MKLIGSKLSSIRLHRTFSTSLPSSFQSLFSSTSPETSSTDGLLDSTHTDGSLKDGIIPLKSLSVSTRSEILSSIKSLQLYTTNNKKFIDQKRKLFKMMSWRQQKICIDVGYLDKLQMIDQLIGKNQQVLNEIVKFSIDKFDVKFSDFDSIKNFADNNSFKVIESLSHLNRDWDDQQEIAPILNFLHDNLSNLDINRQDTSIIVPGSGLGRIGHELALQGWKDVNSIELNGIMYLINLFIYHNTLPNLEIYPYIHSLSNFTTLKNQFRSVIIPNTPQPPNLTVNLEDFKFFEPPNSKNIIVVTVFFIDTAENLIDYIDTINSLVKPYDKKYWINFGPLKYGTAPQVELNVEELTMVREKMGWHDIHTYNSLDKGDIVGYATDKESLWQGYYGLTGWMSSKH